MARKRTVTPEFFTDQDIADLQPLERLLFIGLWCHADKAGRLKDKPRTIKALVLPFDDVDIDAALSLLHDRGFIVRYEVESLAYIQIRTWTKHQNPHHTEKESEIPPCNNGYVTVTAPLSNGALTEHSQDAPFSFPRTRNQEPETRNQKKTVTRFVPPTVDEVQEFTAANDLHIDAQQFVDYYTANGWRVGRNAMKNWQSAVRNWNRRSGEFARPPTGKASQSQADVIAGLFRERDDAK